MRRRMRRRPGAVFWVASALGLLIILHWAFGGPGRSGANHVVLRGIVGRSTRSSLVVRVKEPDTRVKTVPRTVRILPATRVVASGPGDQLVGRAWLTKGTAVTVTTRRASSGLVALTIAVRRTTLDGRLTSWSAGRMTMTVPGLSRPLTVVLTPQTDFRLSNGNLSTLHRGAAVEAVIRAAPGGAWTATHVQLGPASSGAS